MLFAVLTYVTIYAQPAPLKLGAQKLVQLEERVLLAGRLGWQVSTFPYRRRRQDVPLSSMHHKECISVSFRKF